jgi:hypothetical protein
MRILLFLFLVSFLPIAIFGQVRSQNQLQQISSNATTQLNRQILNLENRITQAKKNGADPSTIKQMEDQLSDLKKQLDGMKNLTSISPASPKQKDSKTCPVKWTGSLRLVAKSSGITGTREWTIDVSFTNALPTLNRNVNTTDFNFTDDKGVGNVKDHTETIIDGKRLGTCTCTGEGQAELHEVVVDESDTTYSISAIGPPCNRGGGGTDGGCAGPSSDIVIGDQRLGAKHNILTGTETVVRDIGGLGTSTITLTWNLKRECPSWKDTYTAKRIATLKAKMKDPVSRFIDRVNDELCIQLRVAQALRTVAEQNELYAQGRTKPGKIVTNAKGGESNHNSGLAIDVFIVNCDRTIDLNSKVPPDVVKIANEEGFEWGGDWKKFKDYPHFEMK